MKIDRTHGSVGLVETKMAKIDLPPEGLRLKCGKRLPELTVAYETYGVLSPQADNAVYICHALTGDAHVAGYHSPSEKKPGWWDEMVGPGKGIDTNYYFVVCANILGGCNGTTGPSSVDPATGKPYGATFPQITVADIVHVQRLLLDFLGINRLAAVIGGSLGGMQALEWAIQYPEVIDRCICIASGASLSTQALAFDVVARDAIMSDPNWSGGDYYEAGNGPVWGLAHARKIGHITYLSPEIMQKKFGRQKRANENHPSGVRYCFQVESYLNHQGRKLIERFDANSYLAITQAMDSCDLVEEFGNLEKAFENVTSKFLVIALSSDWLFPPEQSIELANALLRAGKHVSCCTLQAPYGHDAFLVDMEHLAEVMHAFLPWVDTKPNGVARKVQNVESEERLERTESQTWCVSSGKKREFQLIRDMIPSGVRVLDLGCGNGELLTMLAAEKHVSGMGVDIDIDNVIDVIDKGHDIFQGDIDAGLAMIPDGRYDCAILSETLQVVRRPRFVLHEMLRVARMGIVSFSNFGKWSHRTHIALFGRMPKVGIGAREWYDTSNIHLFTRSDFVQLCREDGIRILDMVCIPDNWVSKVLVGVRLCNLGADRVVAKITRSAAETGTI